MFNLTCFRSRLDHWTQVALDSFRQAGFAGVAHHCAHHIAWVRANRQRDERFDRELGVDTKGPVELWSQLLVDTQNIQQAGRYEAIDPEILRKSLAEIHEDFRNFKFIDLGCGKGRPLLIASRYDFSELIGIDFAVNLAAIARENCARTNILATIICQDAAQFPFPPGNSVIFLWNPFGPDVLNRVIDNMLASQLGIRYIIYVNPKHEECFARRQSAFQRIRHQEGYSIWKSEAVDLSRGTELKVESSRQQLHSQ